MKKLIITFCFGLVLFSCFKKTDQEPETTYKPILMERGDLEKSVRFVASKPMKNTGKIYRYGNYLFISETYEGIHIIDNSNPTLPRHKGFLKIPGCVDMAIKDGMLYADNATDLVTIDLTNPTKPVIKDRDINVFPELLPPDNMELPKAYKPENRPKNTIIVKWQS